ncbi:hypothetical protein EDEG_02869 [Edhazardia aedis USNM 41457]|uniref:Uncharacterized protein n=1 Tax=Edhazardia aedis (strain USNM 41457) TaxID=1003232 RepID=J9DJE0_EDHAE|nr:hypothetical protein EDEG_02869 [Edhazardia aedis USNM 41457]|eukprot:EJW02730.1 hypothetical protein EDEG_02869 [Edhazardia aedis USNM 41457]
MVYVVLVAKKKYNTFFTYFIYLIEIVYYEFYNNNITCIYYEKTSYNHFSLFFRNLLYFIVFFHVFLNMIFTIFCLLNKFSIQNFYKMAIEYPNTSLSNNVKKK